MGVFEGTFSRFFGVSFEIGIKYALLTDNGAVY